MYALFLSRQALLAPRTLQWWQWGKALGPWLMLAAMSLYVAGVRWPILSVLALHVFVDFTCQSTHTAVGKAQKDWRSLVLHGFVAGGWPVVAFGPMAIFVSMLLHLAIDATGKFGLKDPYGPVADQLSHVISLLLVVLVWTC